MNILEIPYKWLPFTGQLLHWPLKILSRGTLEVKLHFSGQKYPLLCDNREFIQQEKTKSFGHWGMSLYKIAFSAWWLAMWNLRLSLGPTQWLFLRHIPTWALVSRGTKAQRHTHMAALPQSLSNLCISAGTKKQRRNKCQEALDAICVLDAGPRSRICLALLLESSACKRNGMFNKRGVVNKWWCSNQTKIASCQQIFQWHAKHENK